MGIYLSPRHGVNPALTCCFFCGKDTGLVLLGQIGSRMQRALADIITPGADPEAPRKMVLDREPCSDCEKLMELGILLLSVDEERTTDRDNPYRTGGFAVVSEELIRRLFKEEFAERVCKARMAFVPDKGWDSLGLPRGPVEGIPSSIEEVECP